MKQTEAVDFLVTMELLKAKNVKFYVERAKEIVSSESLYVEFLSDLWAILSAVQLSGSGDGDDRFKDAICLVMSRTASTRARVLASKKKK